MKTKIICLAVGVVLAACLYQWRFDNLVRRHGGSPLPDLRETEIQRAERLGRQQAEREVARFKAEAKAEMERIMGELRATEFSNRITQAVSVAPDNLPPRR